MPFFLRPLNVPERHQEPRTDGGSSCHMRVGWSLPYFQQSQHLRLTSKRSHHSQALHRALEKVSEEVRFEAKNYRVWSTVPGAPAF